ncbi:hypothetical protein INT46_000051 [Mucor plumbeus]|uniref:Homeobox domain-containing protein n=1 Tax=Mucor plumbeus TaxID=97098 RepID=A0A8H7QKH9_9FUNG|nr:hypothetical protein INT46_000051 [Mucor plumbeus]
MVKQKRKIISSKAPQKNVLPIYNEFLHSNSDSPEDAPQSSGTGSGNESNAPDSIDQDDSDDSLSEQSNTTSSSGGFGHIPIRSRRRFTSDETDALEQAYQHTKRPKQEVKQRFARDFDTTVPRIQIWFQNRRAKEKKISDSSANQRASTIDYDSGVNGIPASENADHENPATSNAIASTRRKVPRKNDSSPPVENPPSGKRKKQKQKQNQPVDPVSQQFLPSGSYNFAYPNYAHQFQSINPSSTPNTLMDNESLMYASIYPPRRVYFHDFDWQPSRLIHQSFPQQFQRSFSNERPVKYVDPKKVVRPEASALEPDNISSDKSLSKKGKQKQKQKPTDINITINADSDACYGDYDDSPEIKPEQDDL